MIVAKTAKLISVLFKADDDSVNGSGVRFPSLDQSWAENVGFYFTKRVYPRTIAPLLKREGRRETCAIMNKQWSVQERERERERER